jgi:hypothetical protein
MAIHIPRMQAAALMLLELVQTAGRMLSLIG